MMSWYLNRIVKLVLCLALVSAETVNAAAIIRKAAPPAPTAPVAPPIDQKAIDAAKKVIAMFGGRTDYDFSDKQTETDFENLIRAEKNAITIDDPTTFILWWKINQKTVLGQVTGPDKKPNWEALCLLSYIAYMNQMVAVSKDPTKFKDWQARAAGSSYAETISPYAFGLITVLGGMLLSPTMAFMNGWLKDGLGISFFQVGKDILNYMGVRPIRNRANMLSSRFFNATRLARIRADIDASSAKVAEAIKPFERSRRDSLSPAQAKEAFKVLIEAFTQLSISWARLPEWARKNRDNFVDMLTARPDIVAHQVGSSVNAAQNQRTAANSEVILMGQRNPNEAAALQDLAEKMRELVLKRMRLGELSPEQVNIYRANVSHVRDQFVKLGAPKESVARLIENVKAEYTFTREAASWLAAQMFHSANAYDLTDTMDRSYSKFMDANSNSFFRKSLGDAVELILEEIRQSLGENAPATATVRTIDDSFTSSTLEALDNTPANDSLLEFSEGQTAKRARKASIKTDLIGALKVGVHR